MVGQKDFTFLFFLHITNESLVNQLLDAGIRLLHISTRKEIPSDQRGECQSFEQIGLAKFFSGLASKGLPLTDMHLTETEGTNKAYKKFRLTIAFSNHEPPNTPQEYMQLPIIQQLLIEDQWRYVHLWMNPGGTWCLHAIQRMPANTVAA